MQAPGRSLRGRFLRERKSTHSARVNGRSVYPRGALASAPPAGRPMNSAKAAISVAEVLAHRSARRVAAVHRHSPHRPCALVLVKGAAIHVQDFLARLPRHGDRPVGKGQAVHLVEAGRLRARRPCVRDCGSERCQQPAPCAAGTPPRSVRNRLRTVQSSMRQEATLWCFADSRLRSPMGECISSPGALLFALGGDGTHHSGKRNAPPIRALPWRRPRPGRHVGVAENLVAARLVPVRRLLAIVLLALLPLQFSWAAVAPYCEHEITETGHFGHHLHHHQHHADASSVTAPVADPGAIPEALGDKASAAVGDGCGHCHGYCSVMPTPQAGLPDAPSTARPGGAVSEGGNAHPPSRPERPQWMPLA